MNEESTLVADLSEEQRQELHTQIASPDATLSPAPTSPGVDLIDSLSPQELADVSVQTKGAGFDPASWAAANPNASPEKLQKSADALALLEHRGFKFSDIDLWQSTKHLLSMVPSIGKWAGTALELGVVNPVASLVAPKMTPAAEAEFEKLRTKKSAELAASTEAGVTGLFELGKKGIKKISRATGFLKDPLDQDPQERLNNLFGAAGMAKQQENISKGHGTMTGTLLEGAIADMERGGVHVDPSVVADLSAGDPVSFLAFPGGFKVVAGAGRTAGKIIAKVASRAEAVQLVTTLRSAQRAAAVASRAETQAAGVAAKGLESEISQVAKTGAEAFPEQGGILTAEATPGVSAAIQGAAEASAAARAAEQTLVTAEAGVAASPGARLVERAQRSASAIKQGLVEAKGAVSKAAAATSQRAVDVGLSTVPAAVGVVAKTAEGVGKIVRGILPPLATPHYVRTGAELAGKAGTSSLATAKKLFTGASETYSPSLRLISDVARSAPTVAAGAAKGFLSLDVPLAAVTSETPTDTAHMAVFGAFFGAVGKAPVAAGRIVQGQLIAPRTWSSDAAMRDYRSFSALDAANKFSIDQAKDPAKTQWLASIRDFLKPTDAQMYWVTDEKMFRDALQRYAPDKDVAWYDEAAQQRGVTLSLVDDAGKSQKVILLRDAEAAPHEAIHPFQDVLGDRAMQAIDDLVYNEYAPVWDQVGLNYALKFFGPQKMLEYQSRGEGWQEAVLDATTGTTEWRNSLSPEQTEKAANLYVSRELSAEVGDAILRNAGPELKDNDSFPGKLARILGKTMVGFGMEPFQGAGTEGQGIPLTQQTTEGIKQALRGGVEALKVEKARPDVAGMPGYGRAKAPAVTPRSRSEAPPAEGGTPAAPTEPPPAPNEPGGAAEKARELIPDVSAEPTIRGGRSQQEILADVATAIESRGGLSVDYMSAPGEPAGAITSNRAARRDIIEIFRTMPAAMRKLWEKNFFPEQAVRAGNKVQIIGWSPEVFAANAHKLAKALSEKPGSPPIPYEIDKKTGTFTERGWRELYVDATNFAKNQAAGLTGAGESLVVPAGVVEKGFFPPRVESKAGAPLDQAKADIISALFGIPIPKTPRIGKVYPRNLIGQEVSEATKPGRVSTPVEAREPFSGVKAEALGIEGQTIKEVNPFRAELEAAGVEWSPIEALQRLNLENIAAVTPTPVETASIRGREFTLQAGFQPGDIKRFSELPSEDFVKEMRSVKGGLTGRAYELGRGLTPEDIPALQAAAAAAREKFQAAMKASDYDAAAPESNRKQFFDEALRFRNALTAAEGITDTAKLQEIALEFGVDKNALTGRPGADAGTKFQPKYRREDGQSSFQPKPNEDIRKLANEYALSANLTYRSPRGAKEVDPGLAKKLADYYAASKHDPKDEAVKKSYEALIDETRKQFDRIVDYGYSIEPYTGRGEPYKKSEEMMADLRDNKNLYFLKTEGNFSGEANHPMLAPSGIAGLSNNDLFRAVHDFFGHAAEGLAFGPRGEFNAWRAHSEMYSPEAQGALAAETLAQNSWVNFGEHLRNELGKIPARGEPGYVPLPERQFAEQKAVIVPAALIAEAKAVGGAGERLTENETRLLRSILDDAAEEGKAIHKHLEEIQGAVGEGTFDPTKEIFDAEKQKRLVQLIKKAVEETRKRAPDDPTKLLADALLRKAESGVITPYDADRETLTSEVSTQARFSPAKKKKARGNQFKFVSTSGGTASKAWILPDGTPVQLGSKWHHDWLDQNKDIQEKYGLDIPPFEGNDAEAVREQALQAGFARVNYEPASGRMTVEARAKDWRGLKGPVQDMAEANLDNVEKFSINTLNDAVNKVVDSARDEFLFRLDTPAEKSARISEMIESIETGAPSVAGKKPPTAIEIARARFQPSGETEGLPGFDVAREPLHPSERASMTRQELRNHFPEAVVPRANNETLTSDITASPLFKEAKDEPAAVKAFADRLVAFAKEHKNDPSFDLGAGWYSEFVPKLKKEYGQDAGLMAELLSATSPNTSVETNFGYAFDALESLRAGRFDKIVSKFEEGLAKMEDGSWETWLKRNAGEGTMTPAAFLAAWINKFNLKPQQSNGKLYGQHSLNVLKVLAREWLGKAGGPKTKQFVENLIGRSNEATIDVWADRTMRWAGYEGKQDRWRILAENQAAVTDKDFAFSQKAFRAAADRMKMEPSALQGALWFAEKQRWADNGWSRLNLGSFQAEMKKLPELRKGFQHRMKQAEAAKKAKPREQIPLDISPRFP